MNINITQTAKPIKLGFLIKPGKVSSYIDCINVCTSLWGGMYFPILPFYGKFTEKFRDKYFLIGDKPTVFYNNLFANFRVDYIVYADELNINILKALFEEEKLIPLSQIKKSISGKIEFGIGLHSVLPSYLEENFKYIRNDSVRVKIPLSNPDDIYFKTAFGSVSKDYLTKIKSIATSVVEFTQVQQENLESFLDRDVLGYFDIGKFKLDGNDDWWAHETIFFADTESVDDLIQFWNLRAIGRNVILLPLNDYENPAFKTILTTLIDKNLQSSSIWGVAVIENSRNDSLDRGKIHSYLGSLVKKKVKERHVFSFQHWLPRFWEKGFMLSYDRATPIDVYTKPTAHVVDNKKTITLPLKEYFPISRVANDRLSPIFTNELQLSFTDIEGRYAQVMPEMSTKEIDKLVRNYGGREKLTIKNNRLVFHAHSYSTLISFSLSESKDIFAMLFARHNLTIKISTAGKLTNLLLKNIGGVFGINFFSNTGILPILTMFEKTHLIDYKKLFNVIMKHKKEIRFFASPKEIVQQFIDYKIIKLGLKITCPFCDRDSFYKMDEGFAELKCPVCQNEFVFPMNSPEDLKWAYQVSGPFNLNNKTNGILSVLLTLRFFRTPLHLGVSSFLLSYDILKGQEVVNEVDLTVLSESTRSNDGKPDLIFCECKTGGDFEVKDITKMKQLGDLFPGCILTFATLKTALSTKEKKLIKSVASRYRKGNKKRPVCPIIILTKNELVPENPFDPFANFKDSNKIIHSDPDEMGRLCDLTTERYLGLKPYRKIYEEYWTERIKKTEAKQAQEGK